MRSLLSLAVSVLLVACVEEQPPPNTAASVGTAPATPAAAPAPAPRPAATPAPAPQPAKTADLGNMSNDPEVDRSMRTKVVDSIQPHRPKMEKCYNQATRANPKLAGTISIRLTVAPSGEPVVIDDAGSTVKNEDFVTCVRAVLSEIAYPKWQGKAVTVVVPLEFFRRIEGPEGGG